jgi:hypothetical protein
LNPKLDNVVREEPCGRDLLVPKSLRNPKSLGNPIVAVGGEFIL